MWAKSICRTWPKDFLIRKPWSTLVTVLNTWKIIKINSMSSSPILLILKVFLFSTSEIDRHKPWTSFFSSGPAESLFQESFYSLLKSALKPNGIICCQGQKSSSPFEVELKFGKFCFIHFLGESIWLHLNLIKKIVTFCRDIFPSVAYAFASTPTYPSGTIGFLICSLDKVNLESGIFFQKKKRFHWIFYFLRKTNWKNRPMKSLLSKSKLVSTRPIFIELLSRCLISFVEFVEKKIELSIIYRSLTF